jgi:hypothetical protein
MSIVAFTPKRNTGRPSRTSVRPSRWTMPAHGAPAGGGRHGFSVGHARRSNPDLDVELVFEPVAKDLEMELPHP